MDTQTVDRTRQLVRAMICKHGAVGTRNYLTSKGLDRKFRSELIEAGVLVGEKVNFSVLPVRKYDILNSASISETHSIVSRLIKRDGIDYTISDFSKEPNKQFKKKLVEAGLMTETPHGINVNVSGLYCLANLTEKSSNIGSIQPMKSQSSPL